MFQMNHRTYQVDVACDCGELGVGPDARPASQEWNSQVEVIDIELAHGESQLAQLLIKDMHNAHDKTRTDRQTDGLTYKQTYGHMDIRTYIQTDKQTD